VSGSGSSKTDLCAAGYKALKSSVEPQSTGSSKKPFKEQFLNFNISEYMTQLARKLFI
jgi:hypothetical protein